MNRLSSLLSWTLVLSALHTSLPAADWPTYGGDHHQSGVTTERINVPLKEAWAVRTPAPRPAWPEPARQDFWHNAVDLQPSVTFDRAPHAVVAEGAVYFGSTVDDKITCLDLESGHVRWSFFTEGPVRVTPTVSAGRVYAGSDDGFVYCLAAADGTLLWKHRVGPDDRRLPGNGRMISLWPVRAGVAVHGDTAYCCAGVFPQQGVYVCALNAEDGSPRWKQPFASGAPQGHLLLSDTRLFVPTGRTSPAVFDRVSGKFLGAIDGFGRGGNFALVNEEVVVYRGQGEQDLTVTDVETREKIVRFTGRRMVVRGTTAFLQTAGELSALDRPRFLDLARHRNRVTAHRREIEGHLKAAIKKAKEAPPKESPPKETPLKETLADVIETLRGQLAGDNEELAQIATEMNACWRWRVPCRHGDAMIAAGDVLLLGGQSEVAAVDMAGGQLLWTGTVAGRACGLAFADGRLLVSTDRGAIHCFEASLGSNEPSATPVQEPDDPVATQIAPSDHQPPADERSIHPHIRHTGAGRVVISWRSERPCRSTIQFGLLGSTSPTEEALLNSVAEDGPATDHAVVMDGLEPDRQYAFRVVAHDPDSDLSLWTSRRYTFDASMELMPIVPVDTAPVEPESGAAEKIVSQSGLRRGYCLMLGCGDGRLALEIARRTEMQVLGVEEDAGLVETARKMLDAAGAYGRRVVVHQGSLDKLPFPDRFANLIVRGPTLLADKQLPASEVTRLLHPHGCALLGQEVVIRGKPSPNAGQWTHQYADPGNSACSNDPLGDPKSLQWFGRPGPRQMVDRHHRAMSPLAAGGRLIVPGDNRLMAVDSLNGTPLWDVTIPNSRRVVVLRDSGQVALGGQRVYVAVEDTCWVLNAETGRREQLFRVPEVGDETAHDWGYLASVGDCLLGSGQIRGASRNAHQRSIAAAESHYDNVPTVVSRYLFCLDRRTGRHRWTYRHRQGSVIANPAMAAGADRVFFIESCNPLAVAEPSGRVPLPALLAEGSADLVALDMRSGKIVWRQPLDLSRVRHVLYLYHAGDTVLAVGASDEDRHPRYDLWAFHAVDGRPKWANHHVRTDKPAGGSHGEQDQHPVIVGDVVYSRPAAFELETGRPLPFTLDRGGGGCGTLSGSAEYLFGRGSQPRIYPLDSGGRASRPLSTVSRPGCWINIISADGLVLVPEASSGCSCPLRRSSVDRVFPIADRAIPTILTPADLWYTPAGSQVSSHQGTRDGRARADM